MILTARAFAIALLVVLLVPLLEVTVFMRAAGAADPVAVFIDGRDPAFLVVQGVAGDASDQARREMAGYATLAGVSLVPWNAFRQNAQTLIAPHIVKNEYPGTSTILGVVALVKAYPGEPFGITWNGGLAVSFQDYQYAVTTYKAFGANAQAYEQSRPRTPDADPVNPAKHIAALLAR